jgi:hypothetical protein
MEDATFTEFMREQKTFDKTKELENTKRKDEYGNRLGNRSRQSTSGRDSEKSESGYCHE